MLIQCLAAIGALHLISVFVAVAAVAVYLALQYLKHQSGGPGPSLPPTLDSHLQSFGQNGCTPIELLHLVFVVSFSATRIFSALLVVVSFSATLIFSALLVTKRTVRYFREQSIDGPRQPVSSGYGAC